MIPVSRSRLLFLAPLAIACALAGCSSRLPSGMEPYAGVWRSERMTLSIASDGRLFYSRQSGRGSVRIEAPVQSFDGQGFSAGLLFLSTRFQIDRPPFERDGRRFVVIDGVELALEAPASPGPSSQP